MYESPRHLEGIADEVHGKTGVSIPVDAFRLAELCGLSVRFWSGRAGKIVGSQVYVPAGVRPQRQHRLCCHETAHHLLKRGGCDDRDEDAADYLALALMMPQGPFRRDLRDFDWDLFALLRKHENVSAQAMCVRMTHLSPCATSVYDQGSRTALYLGDGAYEDARDDELADAALTRESVIRDGLAAAYPVIEGRYRRIVVVRRAA